MSDLQGLSDNITAQVKACDELAVVIQQLNVLSSCFENDANMRDSIDGINTELSVIVTGLAVNARETAMKSTRAVLSGL